MKRVDVLTEKGKEILMKKSKEELVKLIQNLTTMLRIDRSILETCGINI